MRNNAVREVDNIEIKFVAEELRQMEVCVIILHALYWYWNVVSYLLYTCTVRKLEC